MNLLSTDVPKDSAKMKAETLSKELSNAELRRDIQSVSSHGASIIDKTLNDQEKVSALHEVQSKFQVPQLVIDSVNKSITDKNFAKVFTDEFATIPVPIKEEAISNIDRTNKNTGTRFLGQCKNTALVCYSSVGPLPMGGDFWPAVFGCLWVRIITNQNAHLWYISTEGDCVTEVRYPVASF